MVVRSDVYPNCYAIQGACHDEPVAYINATSGIWCVYFPSRKSPDAYLAMGKEPLHCLQCNADIPVSKRPSLASMRRVTRHILSHSPRRPKALLTWFDSTKKSSEFMRYIKRDSPPKKVDRPRNKPPKKERAL